MNSRSDTPILDALRAHRSALRFHMPGHHAGRKFRRAFGETALLDVTELSYSDNLQSPSGVIAASESLTADFYGARGCLYSTQGTTLSVFSALFAARERWLDRQGRRGTPEVLLSRRTHKSFFSGCEALGLEPVAAEEISYGLRLGRNTCAAVYTLPDYDGRTRNFDFSPLKRAGVPVVVDGAHGAHLVQENRELLERGADFLLLSAHKFLPSLTQAAFLLYREEGDGPALRRARNLFGTTSPSYPILASLEYGVDFLRREGRERMNKISEWKEEFFPSEGFGGFRVQKTDALRLVVDLSGRGTGYEAEAWLNGREIYPEYADRDRAIFFLGLETPRGDLKKLRRVLDSMPVFPRPEGDAEASPRHQGRESEPSSPPRGEPVMKYLEACRAGAEWVPLGACEGRICAQNCGLYPPADVLVLCGERVGREQIACLTRAGEHVFGLDGGRMRVVAR